MKKKLLLFIGIILMLFTAGSAFAASANLVDSNGNIVSNKDITLTLSSPYTVYYQVNGYTKTDVNSNPYPYAFNVQPVNNGDGVYGSQSDIAVIIPNTALVLPNLPSGATSGTYTDTNPCTVTVVDQKNKDPNGKPAEYRITIGNSNFLAFASVNVSIPEFPTLALPVAAALGVIFIVGRKKEML
jgi:hypothetical protein